MKTHIPIGELKTHCYQILDQAQKNNQKIIITKRNRGLTIIGTKSSSKDFLFHLIFSNSNLTYCSGKGSQMWYVQ